MKFITLLVRLSQNRFCDIILVFFVVFSVFSCTNPLSTKNNINKPNQQQTSQNQLPNTPIIDQQKQYVLGTDDIPLFSGLTLLEDDSSNFDTMTGNIVISNYSSHSGTKLIKDFYHNTLPQLGWQLSKSIHDKMLFIREKDRLEISITSANKTTFIRFFILYQI